MVTTETEANRLRAFREAAGISLRELSRRVAVNAPLLSRVERGHVRSWPRLRRATSEALGIAEELVWGNGRAQ